MAFGLVIMGLFLLILALAIAFLLWFYRDPERKIPSGKNIISPADGKVIEILEINSSLLKIKKGIFGRISTLSKDTVKKGYLVSIFMSPFNVHVNRAPIEGTVVSVKHTPGTFINANSINALQNEKNEIIIKNKDIGKIKVIQVAGFLARRTVAYVQNNQKIKKGQRIGLIKFGSQVCLIMPQANIKIKEGQKVKAGETIIAEY